MSLFTNYNSGAEVWESIQKSCDYDTAYNHCMRYMESKMVHTISDQELQFCRELYRAINGQKPEV